MDEYRNTTPKKADRPKLWVMIEQEGEIVAWLGAQRDGGKVEYDYDSEPLFTAEADSIILAELGPFETYDQAWDAAYAFFTRAHNPNKEG